MPLTNAFIAFDIRFYSRWVIEVPDKVRFGWISDNYGYRWDVLELCNYTLNLWKYDLNFDISAIRQQRQKELGIMKCTLRGKTCRRCMCERELETERSERKENQRTEGKKLEIWRKENQRKEVKKIRGQKERKSEKRRKRIRD